MGLHEVDSRVDVSLWICTDAEGKVDDPFCIFLTEPYTVLGFNPLPLVFYDL